MIRRTLKPAKIAGIAFLVLFVASEFFYFDQGLFGNQAGNTTTIQGPSPSAGTSIYNTTLSSSNEPVKYIATKNVTIAPTASNGTVKLPAISSNSVLYGTNDSLQFQQASFDTNDTIESYSGFNYPFASTGLVSPSAGSAVTGSATNTFSNSPWIINSVSNTVNVTLTYGTNTGAGYAINIASDEALRIDLLNLKVTTNQSAYMNIYVYNFQYPPYGWVLQNSAPIFLNGTLVGGAGFNSPQYELIANHSQALKYLTATTSEVMVCYVITSNSTSNLRFVANFYNYDKITVYSGRELPISSDGWVAMSFDLRGPALVKGFWMWVRSVNLTRSETLFMTIFHGNNSATTLEDVIARGPGTFIDAPVVSAASRIGTTVSFTNYAGDSVHYFNLTTPVYMQAGIYFLVMNSSLPANSQRTRYSVLVLFTQDTNSAADNPEETLTPVPDNQFVAVSNGIHTSWQEYRPFGTSYNTADVSPLMVRVQRELIPTDLNMTINNMSVSDWHANYNLNFSTTNFEWGRGYFNETNLTVQSSSGPSSKYTLQFNWNSTIMASFTFNASLFVMDAYARQPPIAICYLSQSNPLWKLQYNFNKSLYYKNESWTGIDFNFTMPADWGIPINVTYPIGGNHFYSGMLNFTGNHMKDYNVNASYIAQYGGPTPYTLWVQSANCTQGMTTFNRYSADVLYPSRDFQANDTLAAEINAQSAAGTPVLNGHVNLTVLALDGNVLVSKTSSVINSTMKNVTTYNFNDIALYNFTGSEAIGEYLAFGYWFNGSEVGNVYVNIFNLNYSVPQYLAAEEPTQGYDRVYGEINTGVTTAAVPTDIIHVNIENTSVPQAQVCVPVNETFNKVTFVSFNQSNTIYHPNEMISFNVNLTSIDQIFQHEVNVAFEIVDYLHPERVIVNWTLDTPVLLKATGNAGSSEIINITGKFPANATGFNAPVKNTVYLTMVKIFVDGHVITTWNSTRSIAIIASTANGLTNKTNGQVIAVKADTGLTGKLFSQLFYRVNETLFNDTNTFLMFVESSYGVTMTTTPVVKLTNRIGTSVINVTAVPTEGNYMTAGNTFVLNGTLVFENGSIVNNTAIPVHVWINDTNVPMTTWLPLNQTDNASNTVAVTDGNFTGTFLIPAFANRTDTINFTWDSGTNAILNANTTVVLNLTEYVTNCTIQMLSSIPGHFVVNTGAQVNFYYFRVTNIGNTTLVFGSKPQLNFTATLGDWINGGLTMFAPNQTFTFGEFLTAPSRVILRAVNMTLAVNITVYALQSKLNETLSATFNVKVQAPDLGMIFAQGWYVFFFIILTVLAIAAIILVRNTVRLSRKPVAGTLAKEQAVGAKGKELPYEIKKGSELGKEDKKYRSIDDIMKEVKGEEPEKENGDRDA
jgi:hypothetical protein